MKRLTLHRSQSFRGPLILVNRDHPLQEAETPELIPLDTAYPDIRMERRAGKLLSACIQAAGGRGTRSEERRVGKECRSRWSPYH